MKRPNSRRISESETLNATPTPSSTTATDASCHTDNQQEVKGACGGCAAANDSCSSHQTVVLPPPPPELQSEATKIEEGVRVETEGSKAQSGKTCCQENKQTVVTHVAVTRATGSNKMRQNGPESNSGHSVSPTTELDKEKAVNNNKLLIKSDSGFSEHTGSEGSKATAPKQPVAVENVKAIYKSDSGYSEPGIVASSEDEDGGSTRPKQISVEQAHTLFNKRYAAMMLQGQDDLALVPPAPVSPKKPPNAIVEDSEEESDTDDDSVEDGVRLREERRRDVPVPPGTQQQPPVSQRSLTSRRSSTDSSEDGFNLNVRDLKNELKDVEEKFRQAMVANAGLDNDKSSLNYQVELMKDKLEEAEEQTALVTKELREKSREFELLKRQHIDAQRAVQLLQMQLDEQNRLLTERGMVLVGNDDGDEDEDLASDDGKAGAGDQDQRTRAIVSAETAAILTGLGKGPLDVRIKRLADERDDLQDQVRRLKLDLEEEKNRNQKLERSTPFSPEDADWETKRLIDDYKFKIQKNEQDINTLQTNVARLETQVLRFKTAAEAAERSEEELKTERRKLQRELREATTRVEELETANKHLETRLGKLKTAKSNLLKDL